MFAEPSIFTFEVLRMLFKEIFLFSYLCMHKFLADRLEGKMRRKLNFRLRIRSWFYFPLHKSLSEFISNIWFIDIFDNIFFSYKLNNSIIFLNTFNLISYIFISITILKIYLKSTSIRIKKYFYLPKRQINFDYLWIEI